MTIFTANAQDSVTDSSDEMSAELCQTLLGLSPALVRRQPLEHSLDARVLAQTLDGLTISYKGESGGNAFGCRHVCRSAVDERNTRPKNF